MIAGRRLLDLPVTGGNPAELAFLAPGVISTFNMTPWKPPLQQHAGVHRDGNPVFTSEFQLDDVSNTFADGMGRMRDAFRPPATAIREFKGHERREHELFNFAGRKCDAERRERDMRIRRPAPEASEAPSAAAAEFFTRTESHAATATPSAVPPAPRTRVGGQDASATPAAVARACVKRPACASAAAAPSAVAADALMTVPPNHDAIIHPNWPSDGRAPQPACSTSGRAGRAQALEM